MSRRTMPYHRRYHGDALQGYRRLTLEQRGAYTTILDLIYDEGGPIENNERWLAGELNCSLRKVRVLLEELLSMRKIFINVQGKISNHRAETEIENSLKISRKRAEVATKPKRDDGDNAKFRNKISGNPEQMQSNSSVIPVPEPYINNINPVVDEDTTQPEKRAMSVSASPPIPIEALTGNVKLIEALKGRPQGRADLDALLRGQRQKRGGAR
jgi:uncharacterized protein YdaU (DUF1376 family)